MDYNTMQRKDLLPVCAQRGIPNYGTQAQIAARLAKADQQAAAVPPKETPVAQIAVGPDTGSDNDSGDALLAAMTQPSDQPPARQQPELDPQAWEIVELRAQLLQAQAQLAARPGARPTAGDAATPDAIAQAARGEQVFRTEFPMYDGMELGEGLHESFIRQTVERAAAAGFVTRGGARRTGWGKDAATGSRTAVYEIYARKEG